MAQPITIEPLHGLLDASSAPDQVSAGSFVDRLNLRTDRRGRHVRGNGWSKFLGLKMSAIMHNQDLHDQLLSLVLSGSQEREPITFLQQFKTMFGESVLLAGTQRRLYKFYPDYANWQLIADGMAGVYSSVSKHHPQWNAAQVLNKVVITNNIDPPQKYTINDSDTGQLLSEIDSLKDLNVEKAGVVGSWRGVVFLGDIIIGGKHEPYHIIWSDYRKPFNFDPGEEETIAGYQDLDYREKIIAMKELGDYWLIYTDHSIWQVTVVGGAEVFNFRILYSDIYTADGCLYYPNTLTSVGNAHVYLGRDGVYFIDLSMNKPKKVDWVNAADEIIFRNINSEAFLSHKGIYNPITKELFFSYATGESSIPNETFRINLESQVIDRIDSGMTTATLYTAEESLTVNEFLVQYKICSPDKFTDTESQKESYVDRRIGRPASSLNTDSVATGPLYIYNDPEITSAGETADTAGADSLCSVLNANGIYGIDDICAPSNLAPDLIFASSEDWCIKTYDTDKYYREIILDDLSGEKSKEVTADDDTVIGYDPFDVDYNEMGYYSRILTGAMDFDRSDIEKLITMVEAEIIPLIHAPGTTPELRLKVGVSDRARNPALIEDNKYIIWRQQDTNIYKIGSDIELTGTLHKENRTRYNTPIKWPLYILGKYIYIELAIVSADHRKTDINSLTAEDISEAPKDGAAVFSKIIIQ